MSASILALSKELRLVDAEARKLRAEVARLEETFAAMQVAPAEDDQSMNPAEGGSVVNGGMAVMVLPSEASTRARNTGSPVPPAFFDELSKYAGEVSHEMSEYKQLHNELERMNNMQALGKKKNEAAHRTLNELYITAGWTPGEKHRYMCPTGFKDEASRLKRKMVELLQERNTAQAALERQNAELREIIAQIEGAKSISEIQARYQQELVDKKAELKTLSDDIKSIQRIIHQKDLIVAKEQETDVASKLRGVDGDKRVAQHRLVKEQEIVRQNELAIRHRALQIEKLQRRIELIGDAVGGDDTAGEDRVDVEHVEELRKEIEVLSRLRWESNSRGEVLDAEIENLQSQADGLSRVKASTKKEVARINCDHKRYTKNMSKEMQVQQRVADKELGDLEADIDMLQRGVSRQSTQSRVSQQRSQQVMAN